MCCSYTSWSILHRSTKNQTLKYDFFWIWPWGFCWPLFLAGLRMQYSSSLNLADNVTFFCLFHSIGLFLLLINFAVLGVMIYSKHAFQLASLVDEYYLQISVSCVLVSFIYGIIVMIMARWDDSVKDKGMSVIILLSFLYLFHVFIRISRALLWG